MRAKRTFASIILLCLFPWFETRAYGQTKEELEAFKLYQEAQKDLEKGLPDEAIEKLDRAYSLFKMPHILFRKAEALKAKGLLEKAAELLRSVETSDRKLRAKIASLLSEINDELARPVEVEVRADVPGTEVIVDGLEKFQVPGKLQLSRGLHQFEFRKQGYEALTVEREIGPPETRLVEVTMRPAKGYVVFVTDLPSLDGIAVRLGSQDFVLQARADSPKRSAAIEVRAGKYTVLCAREAYPPYVTDIVVEPGQEVEVSCLFKQGAVPKDYSTWGWVTLGAGGAFVVAGVSLVSFYYWRKGHGPAPDDPNRYVFRDKHENYLGFALLGAGIGAGIASYFLFTSGEDNSQEKGARLIPATLGPAILVSGTF